MLRGSRGRDDRGLPRSSRPECSSVQLGRAERLVLAELVKEWRATLTVQEVADRTGYAVKRGGFSNALGRLRSLQLAEGRGVLRAADTLGQAANGGSP
jgi:hypothetical protein